MDAFLARMEQKYFVTPARAGQALALLRRTCRWDGVFPQEQINSLYFDTADLDQHERSLAGEYAKDKVRIRWYGAANPGAATSGAGGCGAGEGGAAPVWLELKSRRGFASFKQRRTMDVPGETLAFEALSRGIVPATMLVQTMAEFGFFSPKRLQPVVVISYWRQRFVEPRTGLHVAFDSHIRSTMIMPGIGRRERDLELPGSVIEVKGPSAELPSCLRTAGGLGSSWTRYSKYSSSLEAHMADAGSVSRLWPSGTMQAGPWSGVQTRKGEVATCGTN